jgi:hypothetical protein
MFVVHAKLTKLLRNQSSTSKRESWVRDSELVREISLQREGEADGEDTALLVCAACYAHRSSRLSQPRSIRHADHLTCWALAHAWLLLAVSIPDDGDDAMDGDEEIRMEKRVRRGRAHHSRAVSSSTASCRPGFEILGRTWKLTSSHSRNSYTRLVVVNHGRASKLGENACLANLNFVSMSL